jgi:hypothetical protein
LRLRASAALGRLLVEIQSSAVVAAQAIEVETARRADGLEVSVVRVSAGGTELVSRDFYRTP